MSKHRHLTGKLARQGQSHADPAATGERVYRELKAEIEVLREQVHKTRFGVVYSSTISEEQRAELRGLLSAAVCIGLTHQQLETLTEAKHERSDDAAGAAVP